MVEIGIVVEVVVVAVVGCKSWGGVELGGVLSWGFGSVGGSVRLGVRLKEKVGWVGGSVGLCELLCWVW